MTDKDGVDVELALKADATGFATAMKVSKVDRFLWLIAPNQVAEAETLRAVTANIERQLTAGKTLAELSPAEQCLVGNAVSEQVRKFANRVAIKERAAELFQSPSRQLSAPKEEPIAVSQSPEAKAEHAQYFWERFWSDAESATVPYVKEVYARLLAGQLRKPGTFSLRTLDVIRYLDEDVARLFHRIRGFVIMGFALPNLDDAAFGEDRLHHSDFLRLAEAGLVQSGESLLKPEFGRQRPVMLADAMCLVHPAAKNPNGPEVYALTRAGGELYRTFDVDFGKREAMLDWFKRETGRIMVTVDDRPPEEWKPSSPT